jgi:diaminopimelate decarboxylase
VLMCLMAQLQVALRVESLADIAVVQRAMRHITQKVPRGSAASVSRSLLASVPVRDFGSLFMWDACVVRSPSHITASLRAGIRTFLIDDEDEAARIQHAHKRLEQVGSLNFVVLLRSCASQSVSGGASIPLMYGCEPKALAGMAARLKSRHAAVVGLCMHVHVQDMGAVLRRVGEAVEALSTHTHQVQFVCLHGDGEDSHSLVSTSSSLSAMRNFRARYRIPHVLCDATRFLFEGSHTVVARVIGHKPAYDESGCVCGQQYFIDDGCYSSFCRTSLPSDVTSGLVSSAQLFPRPTALVRAPTGASCPPEQTCETTVWGQTCDSIDCVVRHARLPSLGTGSWVAFPHMEEACGGYETRFNGFEPPSKRYFVRLT